MKSIRKLEKARGDLQKATEQYEKISERIQLYCKSLSEAQEKNDKNKIDIIQVNIEKQEEKVAKAKEKMDKAQAQIDKLEK